MLKLLVGYLIYMIATFKVLLKLTFKFINVKYFFTHYIQIPKEIWPYDAFDKTHLLLWRDPPSKQKTLILL